MKKIICFGDSNTFGITPQGGRFNANERWPTLLETLLNQTTTSKQFHVIEQGQPNRTLVHNPPFHGDKSGLRYFKNCLLDHQPDLALIMLGTNDLKRKFCLDASEIASGLNALITASLALQPALKVLIICSPPILEVGSYAQIYLGGAVKSLALESAYQAVAKELNCAFFAASSVVNSCPIEGIHWSAKQHTQLAQALVKVVIELYQHEF